MLTRLFGHRGEDRKRLNQASRALYETIVAQARQPRLYSAFGVPDTVAGRFEMVVLHLVLLFRRLGGAGDEAQAMAQAVFDTFATDMDRSMREMGIGDLGVPKRMKAVGKSFYGRLNVYGAALANGDRASFAAALQRNLFPEDSAPPAMDGLADYAFGEAAFLGEQELPPVLDGRVVFAPANAAVAS
ncbi:MAG: ubiquinol-cytochrome C chaperone [Bauldia sp.]|nr:ubiquinol-cytochrome C chaperone [Bauldia sp.]